jgi:hypothetical protein
MGKRFLSRAEFALSAAALGVAGCAGRATVPTLGGASNSPIHPMDIATGLGAGVQITIDAAGNGVLTYNGSTLVSLQYANNILTVDANGQTQSYIQPDALTQSSGSAGVSTGMSYQRISQDYKRKTASYAGGKGSFVFAKRSHDNGVLLSMFHRGVPIHAHVRPNGALSLSTLKTSGGKAMALHFKPGTFNRLDAKTAQTFELLDRNSDGRFALEALRFPGKKKSRADLLSGIAHTQTISSQLGSLTTQSSVSTAVLKTIANIIVHPPPAGATPPPSTIGPITIAQPPPQTISGGGGGGSTGMKEFDCLSSAVVTFADEIVGGAATVRTGALVTQFVGEALAGGTIDAAAIAAAALGSGFAVVLIVGGLFVIGVAAYSIYQDYKSCMGS